MEDDLKRIATRIRAWRNEARLTLQQLGDRSGVSASTIHKIENLQTVPTISVLLKVASGLQRRPSELLAEVETGQQVAMLRRDDRPRAPLGERGAIEHLIGPIPRSQLDVWRVRLEPGIEMGQRGTPWQLHGELAVLVEDGAVEAVIAGERYALDRGDSLHFDPTLPHSWFAGGDKPALVLVAALLPDRLHPDVVARIARAAVCTGDSACVDA